MPHPHISRHASNTTRQRYAIVNQRIQPTKQPSSPANRTQWAQRVKEPRSLTNHLIDIGVAKYLHITELSSPSGYY
jgi:hypothetical protein